MSAHNGENEQIQHLQIAYTHSDGTHICGTDRDGCKHRIALPDAYAELPELLGEGCKLNLLAAQRDADGTLHPRDIIFMPDYLIDISALTYCVQPHGAPALGYVLNFFKESAANKATLLGEAANMFLDICVNETAEHPATYKGAMAKFFREYPLQLSVCEDIDKDFFDSAEMQFSNIHAKVGNSDIFSEGCFKVQNAQLEPSFFCPALGLQGRIDLLQSDYSHLIELKSGKADEFYHCAKTDHLLQMSLYREMLCYSLGIPRESIKTNLFYSRYPLFYSHSAGQRAISEVLMLRNRVVSLLIEMAVDGLRSKIEHLDVDDLNEKRTFNRLWNDYTGPQFEKILSPIQNADPLLKEYFFGYVAFVAREMLTAKIGGSTRSGARCFADVWNAPIEVKIDNGDILIGLTLERTVEDEEGISDIILRLPQYSDDFYPNFRAGDTVFIYRRESDEESAVSRQVTRCNIAELTATTITLHLRHKQRCPLLFVEDAVYAIEHDHLDSTMRSSIRDIFTLLAAHKERTDLLLARRTPRFDTSRTLRGSYATPYIDSIVLLAKQAEDLFMLIGPPGTGKTSQALSSMVSEFHSDGCNVLLGAYTNRAVDEICQALELLAEAPEYIRIGSEHTCGKAYRHRLMKNVIADCSNRSEIIKKISSCRIFVGTIASLTGKKELFAIKKFDVAIIDEATQILESQLSGVWAATCPDGTSAIEKFVLIGDPKQLPAVVAQPTEGTVVTSDMLREIGITNYATSLFERMQRWYHAHPLPGLTATLHLQGRMHPDVGRFANRYFYGDSLDCIPLPHQTEPLRYNIYDNENSIERIFATRRTAFIDTEKAIDDVRPKINRDEAEKIASFVAAYHALCIKNGITSTPADEIGIIVPFRNQITMVAAEIAKLRIPGTENIIIDTVERFQGSQRNIILYGTTITRKEQMETLSATITDETGCCIDRKLNVAATRARCQMFVFGCREVLSQSPIYSRLIEELDN